MNSIDLLLSNIDAVIVGYVQGAFGSLTPIVSTLWTSMFIVFIAIYGYKIMISGRFVMSDLWVHCFRIIAILVIATEWNTFSVFILDIVTNFPSAIAGQMLNGAFVGSQDITSANTALGDFYERGMSVSSLIMEGAGWNITLMSYSWAVALVVIALTGYALMLIALSKIAVAILLAVGPIFILMFIFTQTKSLFEGWLRTLLNYSIIPIFVYGLLALLLTLIEPPLAAMESNISLSAQIMTYIAPFLLVSVVSLLLLSQIMNLASSITGGISLSTMGLGRSVARKIGGSAKTIGGYARSRADGVADRAFRTGAHSSENKLRNVLGNNKTRFRT